MTYNTGNAVPSTDPRDLDDNAQALDRLLLSTAASEPDRLGEQRKTWRQMEEDAEALVSPNVSALAAAVAATNKGFYFSSASPAAISTYDLTAFFRGLGAAVDAAALRTAIGALNINDTGSYAGSAAKLTAARTLAATGDATWSVSFDGSGNVSSALTLAESGVSAGTYTRVTVDSKGRVTAGQSSALPVANGGTGVTTQAAQVEALRAIKPAWTAYTPVITPSSGAFTTTSAVGSYLVLFGICHFQVALTFTTVGTGTRPRVSLPVQASAGSIGMPILAYEGALSGDTGRLGILPGGLTGQIADYANADLLAGNGSVIYINGSYPIA